MAVTAFFDTSILVGGLIYLGPQSEPAQSLLHAVAEKKLARPATAWHCCLEFFSVATRMPPEFRVTPGDALRLLEEEVFGRMDIHDLPEAQRLPLLRAAAQDRMAGGRIYDAHIADVARAAGAAVIVTDNRRHFVAALRHGIRVVTPTEAITAIRKSKQSIRQFPIDDSQ
ncbi:MAG: PIN domain-containing protein [Vicinamibacterales bacterium]